MFKFIKLLSVLLIFMLSACNEDGATQTYKPSVNEPSVNEPSVNKPSVNEPSVNKPSVNEPSVNEPSVNEPSVNEPSVNKPSVNEPSVNEPSVNEPSVNEPSVNEPSVDEPSVNEPSVNEPSVNEPSVDEPSVDESKVHIFDLGDDGFTRSWLGGDINYRFRITKKEGNNEQNLANENFEVIRLDTPNDVSISTNNMLDSNGEGNIKLTLPINDGDSRVIKIKIRINNYNDFFEKHFFQDGHNKEGVIYIPEPEYIGKSVFTIGTIVDNKDIINTPNSEYKEVLETVQHKFFHVRKKEYYARSLAKDEHDSKMCWAMTASTLIHDWMNTNSENIKQYINKKKEENQEYTLRAECESKYYFDPRDSEYIRNGEKNPSSSSFSNIADKFRKVFPDSPDLIVSGLRWYLMGFDEWKEGGPACFKDILTQKEDFIEIVKPTTIEELSYYISDALKNKYSIGLDYITAQLSHAIVIKGATFDENGLIKELWIADNNNPISTIATVKVLEKKDQYGYSDVYLSYYLTKNDDLYTKKRILYLVFIKPATDRWQNFLNK
ncbi:IdeS/Mac family cysteine endopeptidase [Photobacterium damselae]|uniref:IdeS/Mac family cysteine endopeptidase n=1 Tax=Photobacterium damselae TaxID=38293 RepID=UPI00165E319C|nr:IdeS/Mac family cysteine endopeptidase [Photobacterium damselae]